MSLLQGPGVKQAEVLREELGETREALEAGVRDLLAMCAAAPHLPAPDRLDPRFLEHFVRGCRMSHERARQKFETFCVARARHRDLYDARSLTEPPLNVVNQFMDIVPLPQLTDEGYRVTVMRIRADAPEPADITSTVKAILLVSDTRMRDETLITGDVFIWETTAARASLAVRVLAGAGAVRRGIALAQAAYPQRIKRIHMVGMPPYLAAPLHLVRSCVNEKIRNRYYIHELPQDLLEYIPARVLPAEWGGCEESLDVLADKWRRRVDDSRDYLRDLNDMCQRNHLQYNHDDIYGAVGSFRKLDID